MANILVTGGAGNIASALVRKLAERENDFVIAVDNLLTGDIRKCPRHLRNVKFIKCDVNDYNDISPLFFTYRFEYVFHYAAVVGVKRTLENPLWVLRDAEGIQNVLNLSKNTGVSRVYYSSSSEVYGEPFESPQNEMTTPLNSRLPYALVKNLSEAYLKAYLKEFGLNYTIFRFFNTYGPDQSPDFVVPRFIRLALANQDVTVYGDGLQTRTFCYIDDNVEACVRAHYGNLFVNDTINIGADEEVTVLTLAEKIIAAAGSASRIKFLPPLPEGDMARRCPDITRMRRLLDKDLISLDEGICRLISHYKDEAARTAV